MRKIRGFKLNIRPKEIQRRAKKAKLDLAAIGAGDEPALNALIAPFVKSAKASVLYESFPGEEEQNILSPVPGVGYSLCLATLGIELADYAAHCSQQNPSLAPLYEIMAQSALDDATRFVLGLVEDEAKAEHFELSPMQLLSDAPALEAIVARLEGAKINVAASPEGLKPKHSSAFSLSWLARSKSRAR